MTQAHTVWEWGTAADRMQALGSWADPGLSRWVFPDPLEADDDVVAVGADLEPETLVNAYRLGIFPMPLGDLDDMSWCGAGVAGGGP